MFIVVAVLLIYSLLMISVETKTFEIGVMRLIGLSKTGFVALVFTEAMCFVLPSILVGFTMSLPAIWIVYQFLFTEELGFFPTIFPSADASLEALAIGLLIPCLSAILPVKRVLGTNLNDALNVQRAKNTNILISI